MAYTIRHAAAVVAAVTVMTVVVLHDRCGRLLHEHECVSKINQGFGK